MAEALPARAEREAILQPLSPEIPGNFSFPDELVEFRHHSAVDLTDSNPWSTVVFWPIRGICSDILLYKFSELFGPILFFRYFKNADGHLVVVFRNIAGALTAIYSFRHFRKASRFPRVQAAFLWKLCSDTFPEWQQENNGLTRTVEDYDDDDRIRFSVLQERFLFDCREVGTVGIQTFPTELDAVIYTSLKEENRERWEELNSVIIGPRVRGPQEPRAVGCDLRELYTRIKKSLTEDPLKFLVTPELLQNLAQPREPAGDDFTLPMYLNALDSVTLFRIVIRISEPATVHAYEVTIDHSFETFLSDGYHAAKSSSQWVCYFILKISLTPTRNRYVFDKQVTPVNYFFPKIYGHFFTTEDMDFYFATPHLIFSKISESRLQSLDDNMPVLNLTSNVVRTDDPYIFKVPFIVHKLTNGLPEVTFRPEQRA